MIRIIECGYSDLEADCQAVVPGHLQERTSHQVLVRWVQLTGEEVQIGVLDRGLGIPANDFERLFDKFYRVQRPEQLTGTGLGLAICKGIVEAHSGRIWGENRGRRRNSD